MKNYKLSIPDMIKKENAEMAYELKHITIVSDNPDININGVTFNNIVNNIPEDWLEEIKEEPISADEWGRQKNTEKSLGHIGWNTDSLVSSFKAGQENQKLRYKQIQSFIDWFNATAEIHKLTKDNSDYENAKVWSSLGWKACHISHNLD